MTFLQLLHNHLEATKPGARVVYIAGTQFELNTFEELWYSCTNTVWDRWIQQPIESHIIIDEAQMFFHGSVTDSSALWRLIKTINGNGLKHITVTMCSTLGYKSVAYDNGNKQLCTPITINEEWTWSYVKLRFSDEESLQYLNSWLPEIIQTHEMKTESFLNLSAQIFKFGNGHPGCLNIIRLELCRFAKIHSDNGTRVTVNQLIGYLLMDLRLCLKYVAIYVAPLLLVKILMPLFKKCYDYVKLDSSIEIGMDFIDSPLF